MNIDWLDRAVAQRVPVLHAPPAMERYVATGQVLLKDGKGSLAPLGSFEFCDVGGAVSIFPAQSINTTAKTQTLAASMGLCAAWEGQGLLTLRFVHQTDGPDFALVGAEEGLTPEAERLLNYRGFDPDEILAAIADGASVARLGAIPGLMRILASCADGNTGNAVHTEAYSIRDALLALPSAVINTVDLRPWFAARLRGDGHVG